MFKLGNVQKSVTLNVSYLNKLKMRRVKNGIYMAVRCD